MGPAFGFVWMAIELDRLTMEMCVSITGTALKLQIEELQAKNLELQAKNLELQTFKEATVREKETAFVLPTSKSPLPSSFFAEANSTREVLSGRPLSLSWNAEEGMAPSSSQALMPSELRSSFCHGRCPSLHDKSIGHIQVAGTTEQFRGAMSSVEQKDTSSSENPRLPALSLAGSSSEESTSPVDPGSYMDAASDIIPPRENTRPHSPSQSPLSSYFKTNISMDSSISESWSPARLRPDPLPAHESLCWPGPFGANKPAASQGQHARQRALRIAVANRQIPSVELLIKYGADLNFIGDTGRTLLHDAAESNDGEMARMLLDRGANADLMDRTGMTALEVASSVGNLEVAEVLLKSSL
ncbi:ankyrin repeat-containing domain [Cordyceps javanica]|uniref:Ankyrin repeat-containing domain n=1 Tax=Cordyceps javanica TaxID=43265 RepID=A0A545UWJ4_9HYPO|nr:ankyrin repeat-containing domain [Cordyceps javanica]